MATNVFELYAKLGLDSSSFNKGLDTAKGKLSGFGSTIAGGFSKAIKIGAAAIGAASSAVTGFAVSALRTGREFDSSMAQVGATLGKSMGEMEGQIGEVDTAYGHFEGTLRDFARFMGSNTKFTAMEAAQALNYMALASYDAQTSMEMLPNVLNLAAAGNMNLARASDMVTDTQTAFGISLERTSLMVDEMAKAASTGNTNVEQLGEAFLRVGGLARELNGGFVTLKGGETVAVDGLQELEIAFTAMANAGVKGSEAGTHMRNVLLKLSSPTKEGTAALEAMGVSIFDATGDMRSLSAIFGDLNVALSQMTQGDRIQVISDLFNTRDMASAEALLAAVGQDWDRIGESILDAKVPLDTCVMSIQETTDAFKTLSVDGLGGVRDIAATARADLSTFGGDIDKAAESVAGTFTISLEDARAAVIAVDSAMKQASGAANDMAKTQLDNLNGDITKFQSALSDAKIELSDQMIPTLREFVQLGTKGLPKIVEGFQKGGFTGAMEAFGDILSELLDKVVETLPKVVEAGGKLLGALGQGIMDNMDKVIASGVEILNYLIDSMANGGMEAFVDGALQILGALGGALLHQAPALLSMMAELAVQLVQYLADALNTDSGGAYALITSLGNILIANAPAFLEAAASIISSLISMMTESLPAAIPAIIGLITSIGNVIMQNAPIIANGAMELLMGLANGLITALPAAMPLINDFLIGICNFISQNIAPLTEAAIQIVITLANGLTAALPTLIPAVVDMIVQIVLALTQPDMLMQLMTAAVVLVQAIIEGLIRAVPQLLAAIPQIVTNLVAAIIAAAPELLAAVALLLNDILAALFEWGWELLAEIPMLLAAIVSGIKDGIVAIVQCGRDLIEGFWQGIVERWQGVVEGFKEIGQGLINTFKDLFSIHSPSKVFEGFGDNIVAGLSNGISQNDAEAVAQMTQMANEMSKAFESIDKRISETITKVVDNVTKFAKGLFDLISQNAREILDNIAKTLSELTQKMISGATNAINGFMNIWRTLTSKVGTVLNEIIGKVVAFVGDLVGKATEAAEGFAKALQEGVAKLPEAFATIGTNIVNGIWTGIEAGWKWLTEKVSKLATDLLDGAKNALGIKSPSREFRYVGRMVDEGFAKGIDDYVGLIEKAAGNIESAVEVQPTVGVRAGAIGGNTSIVMNIYPSRGMDEKALAREVSVRLADLNNRNKATWRPIYA